MHTIIWSEIIFRLNLVDILNFSGLKYLPRRQITDISTVNGITLKVVNYHKITKASFHLKLR